MITFSQTLENIAYDLDIYKLRLGKPKIGIILLFPGFQALAFYRFQHWLLGRKNAKNPLWWPVIALEVLGKRLIEMMTGIHIGPEAKIGKGLYLPHFGGIILGAGCVIGSHCYISNSVTLGWGQIGTDDGRPTLGDRSYIGPGAVLIGPIVIGTDGLIMANSLVVKSFEDRAVIMENPARAISFKGGFYYQRYLGMETDSARQ